MSTKDRFATAVSGTVAFFEEQARKLNRKGDIERDKHVERPMVFFNERDRRPLIKNLGNWIEKEGFLFFDYMLVPHPAGFKTEMGLYDYTEALASKLNDYNSIESLIDVGIREVAAAINDTSRLESRSFRFPNLTKLDNGHTSDSMVKFFAAYFHPDKSTDRAPFTDLFKNASELNKTALILDTLLTSLDQKAVNRLNDKVARLSELAIELNQIIVEDTANQRHDVIGMMRDNIITPLASWCEAASIYLYQVNALKVSFSDLEAHIQKIKK